MATRRASLADVRGPRLEPRINTRGAPRNRSVNVRGQRYRPSKDAMDFRALSPAIDGAVRAMEAISAASEEDKELAGWNEYVLGAEQFNNEINSDGPITTPVVEGPVPMTGNPVVDLEPFTFRPPAALAEKQEQIGQLARSGVVSPLQNPLTKKLHGRVRGELVGTDIIAAINAEDLAQMTQWDAQADAPLMDFREQFRARLAQGLESVGDDRDARIALLSRMKNVYHKLAPSVAAKLGESKQRVTETQVLTPDFHGTLRDGLEPSDVPLDPKQIEERGEALALRLTAKLDDYFGRGAVRDLPRFAFGAMRSYIESIKAEYKDDTFTRDMLIEQSMEVFEKVRVGRAEAGKNPMFTDVESAAGTSSGAATRRSPEEYDKAILGATHEALAAARGTFRDGDTSNNSADLASSRQAYWAAIDRYIAEKSVDGPDKDHLEREAAVFLRKQFAAYSLSGASEVEADAIYQRGVLGDVDGAREQAAQMAKAGVISGQQWADLSERLEAVQQNAELKQPGSSFFAAGQDMKQLRASVSSLSLPPDALADLQSKMTKDEAAFNRRFNEVAALARSEGKDPALAVEEFMRGTGGEILRGIQEEYAGKVRETEQSVAAFEEQTDNGKRFSPDERRQIVAKHGVQKGRALINRNSAATLPSTVLNRHSTVLNQSAGQVGVEVDQIAQTLVPPDQLQAMSSILGKKGRAIHLSKAFEIAGELSATGHPNFGEEFRARLEAARPEISKEIKDYAKQALLGQELANEMESSSDDLSAMVDAIRSGSPSIEAQAIGRFGAVSETLNTLAGEAGRSAFAQKLQAERTSGKAPRWEREAQRIALDAFHSETLSDEQKAQVAYDLAAMAGAVSMSDIESGVNIRFTVGKQKFKFAPSLAPPGGDLVAGDGVNLRIGSAPLFKNRSELEAFVSDPERFANVAEKLGFESAKDDPMDDPLVEKWFHTQLLLLHIYGRR